jgi:hypothetical protein
MERTEKLTLVVDELVKPFEDGFQVSDLWDVVQGAMSHAQTWVDLATGQDKKDFALAVLEQVLARVDLPGPDFITRRVVLWFAPSLIDWVVKFSKEKVQFGSDEKRA